MENLSESDVVSPCMRAIPTCCEKRILKTLTCNVLIPMPKIKLHYPFLKQNFDKGNYKLI